MIRSLCGMVLFAALGLGGLQKEADAADYFVQYPVYSYGYSTYPTYPSTVYAPTTSYYGGYGYSVYRPAVPVYRPAPVYRWGVNRPIITAPVVPSVPVYVPNTYFYVR